MCSAVSSSFWQHGQQPARLLWPFSGKNAGGAGCRVLLQWIFPTQGSNPCLLVKPSHIGNLSSVQSCPTLCDPMNHSTPGLLVHHQLPEFTQTHVHRVGDAIQTSHPLSSPFPPAPKSFSASGSFPMCQLFTFNSSHYLRIINQDEAWL